MTNHEGTPPTPQPEEELIEIPAELLGVTPESQALYEYGLEQERELEEDGMIHDL